MAENESRMVTRCCRMVRLQKYESDALRRTAPDAPQPALAAFSQLVMTLIAAAVRQAIMLPTKEARRVLALFKQMLPKDLSALER
jgi:hypothetical protein